MAGGRPDGEDDARWSDKNEEIFLNILHDRVKKDPNGAPTFKGTDWHEIDEEMYVFSGERYGAMKLAGKYNRLRVKHRQFSELLEHTGVTYVSSLNAVNAPEDVWQMFYMKHKGFRAFKKKGCPNYELLGLVFNRSTATGQLHHSSSQLPPTSPEERQNEEEFLNYGVHVSRGGGQESEPVGSSLGKRSADGSIPGPRRSLGKGNSGKLGSCMDQFTSSHTAKAEYYTAKAKKYKGEQTEVTSPLREAYSITVCVDALDEIAADVSEKSYNKALDRFEKPYWREVFMKLAIPRRKSWLNGLE